MKKTALLVNEDAVTTLKYLQSQPDMIITRENQSTLYRFIEVLKEYNLVDSEDNDLPPEPSSQFAPTSVTFLPTFDCNLRCVYCYARSGELSQQQLSPNVARAAVDLIVQNALAIGLKGIEVAFHGGGEPTLAWSLLTEIVDYAKTTTEATGLKLHTALVTNGVLSSKQREWLVQNISHVQVSFDGPADLQNIQRPLSHGGKTFEQVMETIRFFEAKQYNYSINTVITGASLTRMTELVDFFAHHTTQRTLKFEPMFECGRCVYSGWTTPDPSVFVQEFLKAWKYAAIQSIELLCSSSYRTTLTSTFCGASGSNFVVTPEGNVTACQEVSSLDDERANIFVYGVYDQENSRFVINHERRQALAKRNIHNMPACANCAIKWHCGGECMVKSLANGSLFDPTQNHHCSVTKMLYTEQILAKLI
jgi:uncharacterized protein